MILFVFLLGNLLILSSAVQRINVNIISRGGSRAVNRARAPERSSYPVEEQESNEESQSQQGNQAEEAAQQEWSSQASESSQSSQSSQSEASQSSQTSQSSQASLAGLSEQAQAEESSHSSQSSQSSQSQSSQSESNYYESAQVAQAVQKAPRRPVRPVVQQIVRPVAQQIVRPVAQQIVRPVAQQIVRPLQAPPAASCCPSGYRAYRSSCYKAVNFRKSLSKAQAESACSREGSHLVAICNAAENQFVRGLMRSVGAPSIWLDLVVYQRIGKSWLRRNPHENCIYYNWHPGRPNNNDHLDFCTVMFSSGKWDDYPCPLHSVWAVKGYVCEQPQLCS